MINIKSEVFGILNELGYRVVQGSQDTFNETPCITFSLSNNSTNLDLGNEISYQDVDVSVHIWADTSSEATRIVDEIEEAMRKSFYRLTSEMDVPNVDVSLFHIVCNFTAIKCN